MTFTQMIDGPDGQFGAYIARPVRPNGAALVVIQEIFGVNEVMREVAHFYAEHGYMAIVPDLFWRLEPGIAITDKTPEDMAKAFELFGRFNAEKGIVDIQATIDFARIAAPKVGAVGYCLGGMLAYLTASQTNVDASVSYYGVSIDTYVSQATNITKPILLHLASEDQYVSKQAQAIILNTAANHPLMDVQIYQGLDHAFARPGGEHFDAAGADLANSRTAEFFARTLLS